jgi:hypothetical protein
MDPEATTETIEETPAEVITDQPEDAAVVEKAAGVWDAAAEPPADEADEGAAEDTPETKPDADKSDRDESEDAANPEETQEEEWDEALLNRAAQDWGMNAEDAKEYGSNADLERAMVRLTAQMGKMAMRKAEQQREARKGDPPPPRQPEPEPQRAKREPPAAPVGHAFEHEFELPPEDEFAEPIANLATGAGKMRDHFNGQVAQLRQQHAEMREAFVELLKERRQQKQEEHRTRFRDAVVGLPEEWKEQFGEGKPGDFLEGGEHYENLKALHDAMNVQVAGYQAIGREPPSFEVLMRQAIHAKFGDKIAERTRRQVNRERERAAAEETPRPTSRKGSLPAEERAAKRWDDAKKS